ncbi:MAG: ABC transporter ATP-binding protein [Trichlorobacter sp.]|nr:ABC transporter ATP-binding protein [Trichlorobacter sp.]
MAAIEIDSLCKSYKGKKRLLVNALDTVSLTVQKGEVFGFLGPNGAGKSTTIKCLMGLIKPTSGSAKINGVAIDNPCSRQNVGYLPENPAFYDYLSAEEYLRFVGSIFKVPSELLRQKIEELLKLLELWEARRRPIRSYSKGMVQRVGLAQALVHDPEICVLDEPMSGLDPIGRAVVKELISELKKQGKSIFFSTHIISDVEKVCDRVGVINKGQLVLVDAVDNIMQQGLQGYQVRFKTNDGSTGEHYVATETLQQFIHQSLMQGNIIESIEPSRKDMEAFFLELVAKKEQ